MRFGDILCKPENNYDDEAVSVNSGSLSFRCPYDWSPTMLVSILGLTISGNSRIPVAYSKSHSAPYIRDTHVLAPNHALAAVSAFWDDGVL